MHVVREDEAVAQRRPLLDGALRLADADAHRPAAGRVQAQPRAPPATRPCGTPSWGGLPPEEFLTHLDPKLAGLRNRLFAETYTADQVAGHLSEEWAARLGLTTSTVIAVGSFDAHAGAVAGEIESYSMVKVMGTGTCDIVVAPTAEVGDHLVAGICGQVDGSVIPGMVGAGGRAVGLWRFAGLVPADAGVAFAGRHAGSSAGADAPSSSWPCFSRN
ncbi:MAG: hypothetical protein WKG07_19840 [Hymenobacter sp.]